MTTQTRRFWPFYNDRNRMPPCEDCGEWHDEDEWCDRTTAIELEEELDFELEDAR